MLKKIDIKILRPILFLGYFTLLGFWLTVKFHNLTNPPGNLYFDIVVVSFEPLVLVLLLYLFFSNRKNTFKLSNLFLPVGILIFGFANVVGFYLNYIKDLDTSLTHFNKPYTTQHPVFITGLTVFLYLLGLFLTAFGVVSLKKQKDRDITLSEDGLTVFKEVNHQIPISLN